MQTIDTLLQQGIPTTSIDMTSLVSGIDANLSSMLANIDTSSLNVVPQMLDLNQDGVINTQDLQMVTQPINCEPTVEALVQTVLDQVAVELNGKTPFVLSDAQLAQLGINLQAAGVSADLAAAVVNDAQAVVDVVLTEVAPTGSEPVVFAIDPSMARVAPMVSPFLAAEVQAVIDNAAPALELTEATIFQPGTPNGTEPMVFGMVQADAGLALVEPGAPNGTEPIVYNDGLVVDVTLTEVAPTGSEPVVFNGAQAGVAVATLVEPGAPNGTEPIVYNDGLVVDVTLTEVPPTGSEPVVFKGAQAEVAVATLIEPAAPNGTEPVVYNDGQTGDYVTTLLVEPQAPNGLEPVVYNDGQSGDSVVASIVEPQAPNGSEPVVFGSSANVDQAVAVVDSWLEAHSGNPWINLTGAATGADASGADTIKLTLHDLLAMPSDASGMLSAKITGDAADTINLSNIFGNGSDAALGHWDVQGSVMQDGQSFTAYSFSGNAQMQVLVDDHIQHVNLS